MSFVVNWIGNNVILKFSDILIRKDILDADNLIYGDSRFDKMVFQIFDFSKITSNKLKPEDVILLSTLDNSSSIWNNRIKVASVATDSYMLEMIDLYSEGLSGTNWKAKSFCNIRNAEKWCHE